jgi:hypothetical protein
MNDDDRRKKKPVRRIEKVIDDMPIPCQLEAAGKALGMARVWLSSFTDLMHKLAHAQLAGVLSDEQGASCAALNDEYRALIGAHVLKGGE